MGRSSLERGRRRARQIFAPPSRPWFEALGVMVTAGIVAVHVVFPLFGDQALFLTTARSMARGAVLYRDVIDVKQPGIFWLYELVGRAFGWSATALHVVELLWMLVLARVVQLVVRPLVRSASSAALAPVAVIGLPYLAARPADLTQVETLIGLPLLAALYGLLPRASGRLRARWAFLAGIAAGVVAIGKLVYLPIVPLFALSSLWHHRIGIRRFLLTVVLPLLAGIVAVLGPTVLVLQRSGALAELRWIMLEWTPAAASVDGRHPERLVLAGGRFVVLWAPLLCLAAVAVFGRTRQRRTPLVEGCLVWLVAGAVALLLQHWWGYLFYLFTVPVGLLAALGFDDLRHRRVALRRRRIETIAALLAVPVLGFGGWKMAVLARHEFGATAAGRRAIHEHFEPHYALGEKFSAWLEQSPLPVESAYVLGDPVLLFRADQTQSLPLNGWSPEFFTNDVWRRWEREVRAEPPSHLATENVLFNLMVERAPNAAATIEALYCRVGGVDDITWWLRRGDDASC